MNPVLLASASPRRRELLARLGLPFEVRAADVDETPRPGEPPADLALRLARAKAARVGEGAPDRVVLAADTVVAMRGTLYGKPEGPDDARRMLRELVGRSHRVITGVAVIGPAGSGSAALASAVTMRAWSDEEIAAYVASGDPLDKAGAYAIQNERFRPVAALRGCRCNVVGFPIGLVAALLATAGVQPPVAAADACPYRRFNAGRCCPPLA